MGGGFELQQQNLKRKLRKQRLQLILLLLLLCLQHDQRVTLLNNLTTYVHIYTYPELSGAAKETCGLFLSQRRHSKNYLNADKFNM